MRRLDISEDKRTIVLTLEPSDSVVANSIATSIAHALAEFGIQVNVTIDRRRVTATDMPRIPR